MNLQALYQQQCQDSRLGAAEQRFRTHAWETFQSLGLPRMRDELWRYTNPQQIVGADWILAPARTAVSVRIEQLIHQWQGQFEVIAILNGEVRKDLSALSGQVGLSLVGMDWQRNAECIDGLSGAMTALARSALGLEVSQSPSRPILILHVHVGQDSSWTPSHHQIRVQKGVQVDIGELFVADDRSGSYLRSDLMQIELAENAQVRWTRVQSESASAKSFSEVQVSLKRDASIEAAQVQLGGQLARSQMRFDLLEAGAGARIFGLTQIKDNQHVDLHVGVRHVASHTESHQLFKNIISGQACGVINGKIGIAPNISEVVSSHYNHSLLMNPGAQVYSKPELEIYSDNVKANHGASIGRLDDDKLFYLMSRGIPREDAEKMLANAFWFDVFMKISSPPLRSFVESVLRERGLM